MRRFDSDPRLQIQILAEAQHFRTFLVFSEAFRDPECYRNVYPKPDPDVYGSIAANPAPSGSHFRFGREKNLERRNFYELCWHLGGSQTDIANLTAEDIDWNDWTVCYNRQKLESRGELDIKPPLIKFGQKCAAILKSLPKKGAVFPYLRTVRPSDRATEFKQRS